MRRRVEFHSPKKNRDIDIKVPFLAEDVLRGVALQCARARKYMTVKGLSPTCYELAGSVRASIVAGGKAIRIENVQGRSAELDTIRGFVDRVMQDMKM
ncbi:hypothetical protein PINS_up021266 [Pythium insidiosum]|nr:hypothetical protein PINS_up021266 [Pythium insidiosum]